MEVTKTRTPDGLISLDLKGDYDLLSLIIEEDAHLNYEMALNANRFNPGNYPNLTIALSQMISVWTINQLDDIAYYSSLDEHFKNSLDISIKKAPTLAKVIDIPSNR